MKPESKKKKKTNPRKTKKVTSSKNKVSSVKKTSTTKVKKTNSTKETKSKVNKSVAKKTTKVTKTPKQVVPEKKTSVTKVPTKEVKKELKLNKKRISIVILILFIIIVLIMGLIFYKKEVISPILSIDNVYLNDDNKVIVKYSLSGYKEDDKIYCLYTASDDIGLDNNSEWKLTTDNKCEYDLDQNIYIVYLKDNYNNIVQVSQTSTLGTVTNLKINTSNYYLALDDTIDLGVTYDTLGYVNEPILWTSSNEEVASVTNGKVTAIKDGTTTISASIKNKTVESTIVVTSLITKRPTDGFDFNKENLGCDIYTKEDNDLLDKILKFKINSVGNKTRAAVVEAARFLTLDFPYRINYFYENGRLTQNNKIDAEGRYYHKGLYLDESRYDNISKSTKKPKTWGCSLYSYPDKKNSRNGLDCSGFVSWALLNGGFNPGDIGAGITKKKDLTDLGTKKSLTSTLSTSNKIKVGDLLHNKWSGGHIAIIVGIDDTYYYVAQAVWFDDVGVIINKYKKNKLQDSFKEVILMDNYYKNDGKLTNMW